MNARLAYEAFRKPVESDTDGRYFYDLPNSCVVMWRSDGDGGTVIKVFDESDVLEEIVVEQHYTLNAVAKMISSYSA